MLYGQMSAGWSDNSPDCLQDITARLCVLNLHTIRAHAMAAEDSGIHIPREVGEKIFQVKH